MATTHVNERLLMAPVSLGLDARADFRRRALEALHAMPEGGGRLVVDLSQTTHIDSAGLGALMLIQRSAGERRQRIALVHPSDELRFLLVLTKLADLFEIQGTSAGVG